MKNYSLPFGRIDQDENFRQFAKEIDGYLENNDTITLSGVTGKGQVKKMMLEPGLYMRTWNVVFNQPTDLCKVAVATDNDNSSYNVIYILTPESVFLKKVGQHQQYNKVRVKSTLLASDQIGIEMQAECHCQVQLIDFRISAEWLRQHLHAG